MPSLARDAAQKPNNRVACLRKLVIESLAVLCAIALCTFPSTWQHIRHTRTYFGVAEQRSLVLLGEEQFFTVNRPCPLGPTLTSAFRAMQPPCSLGQEKLYPAVPLLACMGLTWV